VEVYAGVAGMNEVFLGKKHSLGSVLQVVANIMPAMLLMESNL